METIILAGGSGKRLWPLSTKNKPKQFVKFEELNNKSLFQLTILRALNVSKHDEIIIVTNEAFNNQILEDLREINVLIPSENIINEPCQKNTLPAIAWAMKSVKEQALVLPSDQFIENDSIFFDKLNKAVEVSKEKLVTFGITAKHPETGFGYIQHKNGIVINFKEKPNEDKAKEYIEKGYLWNSGMFLFDKKVFFEELKKHNPEAYLTITQNDSLEKAFNEIQKISVDYGLLERSNNIATSRLDINWIDLGSFDALHDFFKKDENNNHLTKDTHTLESENNLLIDKENKQVIMIGIQDVIVINNDKGLLICKKNNSQKVKDVLQKMANLP